MHVFSKYLLMTNLYQVLSHCYSYRDDQIMVPALWSLTISRADREKQKPARKCDSMIHDVEGLTILYRRPSRLWGMEKESAVVYLKTLGKILQQQDFWSKCEKKENMPGRKGPSRQKEWIAHTKTQEQGEDRQNQHKLFRNFKWRRSHLSPGFASEAGWELQQEAAVESWARRVPRRVLVGLTEFIK